MTKCPKCGANRVDKPKHPIYAWEFVCGSFGDEGYLGRSMRCKDRQIAALTEKLEAWSNYDRVSKKWAKTKDPSPEMNDKLQEAHKRLKELELI